MANLGFQAVFRILATTPGVVCERAFLSPGRGKSKSLESGRPLGNFDIVAFSLSFESDYPNVVRLLDAAGIPARSGDRHDSRRDWPLLLAGGPACFLNPEPVAAFFDVFLIGEAEEVLPEAFGRAYCWRSKSRESILEDLGSVVGAYRTDRYIPTYGGDGVLEGLDVLSPAPSRVKRRYITNLDAFPVTTSVVAPGSVFGDKYLVEASRGCEWGCRFCAAGFMYRPVRHRSSAGVAEDALRGLELSREIGLVGAELASHPGLATTCERVADGGGRVSPSSLKADVISPRLARALGRSGTRSVTIAPEAGSERLRRVINKNLSEGEILRAADLMSVDGVDSLKLYFMCALPSETDGDLAGIADLTKKLHDRMERHGRKRGRVGKIKLSVSPFVPKPWTPFQWEAMLPVAETRRRIASLKRSMGPIPNVDVECDSPREAYLQTLLSRGDRRVAEVVEALARGPRGWWQQIGAMRRGEHGNVSVNPDLFVDVSYDYDRLLPWDFLDHGIEKKYLWLERQRALAGRETEPCDVATCVSCGAC